MVYCVKIAPMKKLLPIIFFVFIYFQSENIKSQNTYDPYVDFGNPSTLTFPGIFAGSSFAGEYQMFIRSDGSNHWVDIANADPAGMPATPYSLSYKIEVVSFPFTPLYSSSGPMNRVLHSYANSDYNSTTNLWEGRVQREYRGSYVPLGGGTANGKSINGPSTLISQEFKSGFGSTIGRIIYPHTILKHTIYIYCQSATIPVDSLQFIVDNTRGRMRYYPFYNSDPASVPNPAQHDILLASTLFIPGSTGTTSGIFNATSNGGESWNPLNPVSTINYYPSPYGVSNCPGYYPSSDDFVIGTPDTRTYIHPPPYSLSGFQLLNSVGDKPAGYDYGPFATSTLIEQGHQHHYVIDQPIDLTIINPSQKIIYNPSETDIDLHGTLTFPSGYVFKTVDGIYPTPTQVFNGDPNRLYNDPRDIPHTTTLSYDDVGNTTDGIFSYYYIKNGSTLNIEACVGIYDAEIVVEAGGTLTYDPNQTYGNYNIVNAGGTVNTPTLAPSVNCAHDCYDISKYDVKNITISSNTTWTSTAMTSLPNDFNSDGIVRIGGTFRITAGNTLTINGTTGAHFEFGENSEIIVERGAKLIVNSPIGDPTTFTSASICKKSMWNGISVWGDPSLHQGSSYATSPQGVVKLTNVKISNARNAITTRNGSDGWTFNGGVIQCFNVEFKNNRRSVEFLSYHNIPGPGAAELKNISYLKNCQFLMTDYLNDPIYQTGDGRKFAGPQVTMWDVKDVTIESCLFANTATKTDGTPLFDTDLRGTAIYAIDAGVRLNEGTISNEFDGWSDAVWLLSDIEKDYMSITGNVFKNNVHRITLEATDLSTINKNTFQIPRHEINSAITDVLLQKGYNKPTGLYLISATNFTAQENTFTNFGMSTTYSAMPQEYNYGMVINNCSGSSPTAGIGAGLGYAYKNSFNNVNVNLQTELDNKGPFDPIASPTIDGGLEYKCNNFNTRINFDVTVPDKPIVSITSLIRDQGFCNTPEDQAGNSYTACSGGTGLDFDINSQLANSSFLYKDQSTVFAPSCSNAFIVSPPCPLALGSNSCPSNFSLCSTLPCLATYYSSAQLIAKNNLTSFENLIDGGNTSFLLGKINSTMPPGLLKNLLMSDSPYLSDTVLIAMLNRSSPLPPGNLKQIVIANSPVTSKVMTVIQNAKFPSGILNNITVAQTGISARSQRENELNYYTFQAKLAQVNLIQGYLNIENIDSVKAISKQDTTLSGLFKQIAILISQGDYTNAQICMNKVQVKEGGIHTDKCKINTIRLDLAQHNKSWFDMTPSQLNVIEQIYESNPETEIEARTILALTQNLQYQQYPFDVQPRRSMSSINPETVETKPVLSGFKVYPNPSTDYTNVEIHLSDETVNAELIVYNLLGAEILKRIVANKDLLTINTKDFNSGIYLFALKTKQGIIEKQKVIVTK